MDIKKLLSTLADLFMFQMYIEDESDGTPKYTAGSITWGIMLRTVLIVLIAIVSIEVFDWGRGSSVFAILIWIIAVYPGFQQFQEYYKKIDTLSENTMCGTCKYFDAGGQLCKIFDEHIREDYLPCDGQSWEFKDSEMD